MTIRQALKWIGGAIIAFLFAILGLQRKKIVKQKEEIKENGTLRITTDRETIFAFSQVGYDKNYEAETETTYTDSSAQAEVAKNIR